MGGRRKHRPAINSLTKKNPESEVCCWFCGNTRNVPAKKYDGLCMSCWWEFHEDDIALEIFGLDAMA
ncbi:MAG: hypothetical protein EOM20_21980 [Spartobacteria bacterium]|nr:hypothetical protein [Spartobacteria bacterium]